MIKEPFFYQEENESSIETLAPIGQGRPGLAGDDRTG